MSELLLVIDVPVNVIPYPRVQVRALPGHRMHVDNAERLGRLRGFYEELRCLLPARVRNASIREPVKIEMRIWRRGARGDIDNLAKTVLDGLVRARVLADDDIVCDLRIQLVAQNRRLDKPRLIVTIESLPSERPAMAT